MNGIAIWGTGDLGRNIFYKLRGKENIKCWYEDQMSGDHLYDLEIRNYCGKKDGERIVVAEPGWKDICIRLQEDGLQIIDDYVPYWFYNRKMIGWKNLLSLDRESMKKGLRYLKATRGIAIIYGNCQTELIQRFMAESDELMSRYIFVNIPRVCQEDDQVWNDLIESGIFSFCDLFIYQIVLDNNRFGIARSTSRIEKLLNENCIKVSIPNIYFDGYFPQLEKNPYNVLEDVQEDGLFKWGDKFVNKLLLDGTDTNQIIKIIFDEDYLSYQEVQKHIDNSFENLEMREQFTDIKISDYIRKNFEERQLFFSPNHPNNELLIQCAIRILDFLGMDNTIWTEPVDSFMSLMSEDVVIYPSVIRQIGLKTFYKSFFPNRYIENLAYSATEYYRLYCEIVRKELLHGESKCSFL